VAAGAGVRRRAKQAAGGGWAGPGAGAPPVAADFAGARRL